jgi:hypothetical protein
MMFTGGSYKSPTSKLRRHAMRLILPVSPHKAFQTYPPLDTFIHSNYAVKYSYGPTNSNTHTDWVILKRCCLSCKGYTAPTVLGRGNESWLGKDTEGDVSGVFECNVSTLSRVCWVKPRNQVSGHSIRKQRFKPHVSPIQVFCFTY